MKNKATIVAIDTGNKLMKCMSDGGGCTFSSGLTNHLSKQPPAIDDIEILQCGGNYYTVSPEHIPNCNNKTEEDRYTKLCLIGIAKELNINGIDQYKDEHGVVRANVILAMGLPITHYDVYKNDYRRFYRNGGEPYVFKYKELGGKLTQYEITVDNVFVYPQGLAATQSNAEVQRLTRVGVAFLIDIGGYTTDIVMMEDGKLSTNSYDTLNKAGMNTLYAKSNKRIQAMVGEKLSDNQIDKILAGEETNLPKKVVEIVCTTAAEYAKDFVNSMLENGDVSVALATVVFAGGGSLKLMNFIKSAVKARGGNAKFLPEIKANAIGYYMLTRQHMQMLEAKRKA